MAFTLGGPEGPIFVQSCRDNDLYFQGFQYDRSRYKTLDEMMKTMSEDVLTLF